MKASRHVLFALPLIGLFTANATFAIDGPGLYKEHCARCHGDTGQADTWRGRLYFAKNFTREKWQASTSDEEILKAINRGPHAMPAFEKKLTLEERQALVKVVRDLSTKK